jgi:hypothetical protein
MLQGHTRMAWADTGLFSALVLCHCSNSKSGQSTRATLYFPKGGAAYCPFLTEKEFAMVTSRKVRKVACCVVRAPEHPDQPRCHSLASGTSPRPRLDQSRPSDLLPWADPYIAQLVRNLQHEVRHERSRRQPVLTTSPIVTFPIDAAEPARSHHHPDRQWPLAESRDFRRNTTRVGNRR